MGIVPVASGNVRFVGRDITRATPEEKVRLGISVSPEGRRIFASLTVAENLQLGAGSQLDKVLREELLERYLAMFLILKQRYQQKAGTLSVGERQRLALSRCLMANPRQQIPVGPNYQVPLARAVKQAVGIPVIAVGLITGYDQAEAIVATGDADLVALARTVLYDPRWPWHAAAHLGASVKAAPQYLRCQPRQFRKLFDPA